MFHSRTTIWRNPKNNTQSFKEKRLIFGLKETLKSVGEGMEIATRPIRGGARILAAPLTVPAKALKSTYKTIYKWTVPPTAEAIMITLGTAAEAGKGAWKIVGESTKSVGIKGPYEDIKSNLYELPRYIGKKTFELPSDVIHMPSRFASGIGEMLSDIPTNTKELVVGMRDDIAQILNGVATFKPTEAVTGTKNMLQHLWVNGIRKTRQSLLKPLSRPLKPVLDLPVESGRIILNSKTQYKEKIGTGGRSIIEGIRQIIGAPGHKMNIQSLEELKGGKFDKEESGKVVSMEEAKAHKEEEKAEKEKRLKKKQGKTDLESELEEAA